GCLRTITTKYLLIGLSTRMLRGKENQKDGNVGPKPTEQRASGSGSGTGEAGGTEKAPRSRCRISGALCIRAAACSRPPDQVRRKTDVFSLRRLAGPTMRRKT